MKVSIYSRVSTDKQDCENQLVQLRDFAAKQGWTITREYLDEGISGTKADRAGLHQLLTDADRRRFDLVLFWALDRLSREGVLQTLHYLNRLEAAGVGYRSFTEPYFDSCGVFKDAIIAIMATLAKQESVKRSERTRAGLAVARAKGSIFGRPRTVDAADVARLRTAGLSGRAIARELGISEGSVRRISKAA